MSISPPTRPCPTFTMSPLKLLKRAVDIHDVAELLRYQPSMLSYILYKKPKNQLYSTFTIPKKSGGFRIISSPCEELKELQHRLSLVLQNCISEINKSKKIDSSLAHGFKRGFSIVSNASTHKNKRYVFNIDLEDFFGSINFGRVRGFFLKNKNFLLSEKVSTILAQIICFENSLPQGSPCSPVVSNLIGHILDVRLASLACKHKCSYSRYADDITFSSNKKIFPISIARKLDEVHEWECGIDLKKVIERSQFNINLKKVRMQYGDSQQTVTGLTVNTKVSVNSKYRRLARAMAYNLFSTGNFQKKDNKSDSHTQGNINQLCGIFSFIYMVNNYKVKKYDKNAKLSSMEEVHRKLLFYKNFYSCGKPTVISEGKTDNIYLQSAILSLAEKFPELAQKNSDGKYSLKINFFKYTNQSKRLLEISGGSSDLAKFVGTYSDLCESFSAPRTSNPVIILIDNDQGAKKVYSAVKESSKSKENPDKGKPYHYVAQNLYVVATPLLNGAPESKIEDFFNKETLNAKFKGKSFNVENVKLSEREYGKHIFSESVIKPNRKKIDFSGFTPLLEVLNKIVVESVHV